jgi:hypothetical protein
MTRETTRRASERGSVLILVIGIVAALALLTTTIVVLAANSQHFTYEERTQTKAFNVAEAGLDAGMYTISKTWPEAGGAAPTMDLDAFEAQFPANDGYPRPATGDVATWEFYDNLDVDHYHSTDTGPAVGHNTDENGDNLMYVRVTGRVGDKDSTVQALVQRTPFKADLPKGLALYASGDVDSNGGGNNPKLTIEGTPSTGVTAIAGGTILEPGVIDVNVNQWDSTDDPPPPALDSYLSPEILAGIEQLAKEKGRFFTTVAAALSSPVGPDSPTGGLSGLCVIRTSEKLDLKGNDVINSVEKPGILMLLGGGGFDFSGTTAFYGFLYTDGDFSIGNGTPRIEGMLVTTGDFGFIGTADLAYNEACILNLEQRFYLYVKVMQGTWREI